MTRPVYAEHITSYFDGPVKRQQVEYTFGIQGEQDAQGHDVFFRDTLREGWADRTQEERLAEAEARYDRWVAAVNVAIDPAVPTLQALRDDVAAQEDALRQQQRQLLDSRDRLSEAEANATTLYAVADGAWNDPKTWASEPNGEPGAGVPDVDTRVVIPSAVAVNEIPAEVSLIGTVQAVAEPVPEEPIPDEG